MDITNLYQGLFMGVGNTIASFVTFLVPIVVAYTLREYGDDWTIVFQCLVVCNLIGVVVVMSLSSVRRIDDAIMQAY